MLVDIDTLNTSYGIETPLQFTGTMWPVSQNGSYLCIAVPIEPQGDFQLYIVIKEDDGDLVTQLYIEEELEPMEKTKYTHQGQVLLAAQFSVVCKENYFGLDCATFCEERGDELGHFTCDGEGNKVCLQGYKNPSTNCTECIPADGCCEYLCYQLFDRLGTRKTFKLLSFGLQ